MSRLYWNGKRYNSYDELCDEAGFHGKQREKFKTLLYRGFSVDKALAVIYEQDKNIPEEHDITAKTTGLECIETFNAFCDKHNIKYKEAFYYLTQTYTLKSALKIYREHEQEYAEHCRNDKYYSDKRYKQSMAIYEQEKAKEAHMIQEAKKTVKRNKILEDRRREIEAEEYAKAMVSNFRAIYGITDVFDAKSYRDELILIKRKITSMIEEKRAAFLKDRIYTLANEYNLHDIVKGDESLEASYRRILKELRNIDKKRARIEKLRREEFEKTYTIKMDKAKEDEVEYKREKDAEKHRIEAEKKEREAKRKEREAKRKESEAKRKESEAYIRAKNTQFSEITILRNSDGAMHQILWNNLSAKGQSVFKRLLNKNSLVIDKKLEEILRFCGVRVNKKILEYSIDVMRALEDSIPYEVLLDIIEVENASAYTSEFVSKLLKYNIFGVADLKKYFGFSDKLVHCYVFYVAIYVSKTGGIKINIPYLI